jgi:hypothetical protein
LGDYAGGEDEMALAGRKKAKGKRRPEKGGIGGESSDENMEEGPSAERKRRKAKIKERKRIEREMDEQVPARLRGKSEFNIFMIVNQKILF